MKWWRKNQGARNEPETVRETATGIYFLDSSCLFTTKKLLGCKKVEIDLELGLAYQKAANIPHITLPILSETFLSLIDEGKPILITNEIVEKDAKRWTEIQKVEVEKKMRGERKRKWEPTLDVLLEKVAAREEEEKKKKEARQKEMEEWISKHGSERLRRARKRGYCCNKQYLLERVEKDFDTPATLAHQNDVEYKDRSCPTLSALDIEKSLIDKGHDASIHWGCREYENEHCEDIYGEIVVIHHYLGSDFEVIFPII